MEELGLVGDLAVVAAAALAGGVAARFLRLPAVIGYLAAGVAIGPHTPGPSGDIDDVQTIADLGVALLMFTLGIQFSIREVNQYRGVALIAGIGATLGVMGSGFGIGLLAGLSMDEALIVGMAASITSSMVAGRLLEDRGVIGAEAGRIAIAVSLVNDLAVVFMLLLIPVLQGDTSEVPLDLAIAVLKAVAVLAAILVLGIWVLPRILGRIAASRTRELFVLTMVALALGTAAVSAEAGLSVAFGAFLAGLVMAESEYAHRSLIEVVPLREVFAVVFFVAIGMLIDPDVFRTDAPLVMGMAAVAVFGRIALIAAISTLLRFPLRTALMVAVSLGSMGEFSFVVARAALDENVISPSLNESILASVVISLVAAPLLFAAHEPMLAWARGAPGIGPVLRPRTDAFIPSDERLVNHAIIVGFTDAGRETALALAGRRFRYSVIDEDPVTFRELSAGGVPCVLGNAAIPAILKQAGIDGARVLAITTHDPGHIESVAAVARQLNRRIDIVARGVTQDSPRRLRQLGVARIVQPEFEVGQQFVRHTLQRFGVTSQEVQALLMRVRRDRLGDAEFG